MLKKEASIRIKPAKTSFCYPHSNKLIVSQTFYIYCTNSSTLFKDDKIFEHRISVIEPYPKFFREQASGNCLKYAMKII